MQGKTNAMDLREPWVLHVRESSVEEWSGSLVKASRCPDEDEEEHSDTAVLLRGHSCELWPGCSNVTVNRVWVQKQRVEEHTQHAVQPSPADILCLHPFVAAADR